MKTALQILNQVEPNGELLNTEIAIRAMELYVEQQTAELKDDIKHNFDTYNDLELAFIDLQSKADNMYEAYVKLFKVYCGDDLELKKFNPDYEMDKLWIDSKQTLENYKNGI